jgi:hypothetical protein
MKKDDNKEPSVSFESGPPPGEGSDGEAAAAKGDISAPKSGVVVTADDLADEEWGQVKEGEGPKVQSKKEKERLKKEKEKVNFILPLRDPNSRVLMLLRQRKRLRRPRRRPNLAKWRQQ